MPRSTEPLLALGCRDCYLYFTVFLQEAGLPEFGFIVEKMTSSGSTRFEDPYRLPQGLPINHTTFCAKILGGVSILVSGRLQSWRVWTVCVQFGSTIRSPRFSPLLRNDI